MTSNTPPSTSRGRPAAPPGGSVCTGYLAPEGLVELAKGELQGIVAVYDRLIIAQGPPQPSYWSQNVWYEPQTVAIRSIADGARQLRAIQRNWWLYDYQLHRRSGLIQKQLPHVSAKPLTFPATTPRAPLGSWMLVDQNTILAASRCSSPFPNGQPQFLECRNGPPSRAYLKLWEALLRVQRWPGPTNRCLELGASPGGWTWVLAKLGAQVLAVDRAPLAPEVAKMPGVGFHRGNAFAVTPDTHGPFDWLFSDVICYPEKLFRFLAPWLAAEKRPNMICTLKFQGDDHYGAIAQFAAVPGSQLIHLAHNKHELTWILLN